MYTVGLLRWCVCLLSCVLSCLRSCVRFVACSRVSRPGLRVILQGTVTEEYGMMAGGARTNKQYVRTAGAIFLRKRLSVVELDRA